MTFRALPENLHALGQAALRYFSQEYGIPIAKFKFEEQLDGEVGYRPSLHARKADHTVVALEISDRAIPQEINALVLGCKNNIIPLKLWVVVPYGSLEAIKPAELHFFKENGLGLIELDEDGRSRQLAGPPLALSLTGVRSIRYNDFPPGYRDDLRAAYDTFTGGNPAKGCGLVYDEIEGLTRKIFKKAEKKGFLNGAGMANSDTAPWATVLNHLKANLIRTSPGCVFTDAQFNRLLGLTEYRNESGHKPRSAAKLIERDRSLRTRFESAVDELKLLIATTASLRP